MGKQTTKAARAAYLSQYKSSGLSKANFCNQEGIALSTFNYWLKRENQIIAAAAEPSFVRLNIAKECSSDSSVRIHYPNGICIEIPSFDTTLLTSLFRIC